MGAKILALADRNIKSYYNCISYVKKVKESYKRYLKIKFLEMKTKIPDIEIYTR